MANNLGEINLIRWQGRRAHRGRSRGGVSLWTVALVLCTVSGGTLMGCQALGWLRLEGPLAAAPAALVVLAISTQIFAVLRAGLMWLGH